jgi:hypothetical protein
MNKSLLLVFASALALGACNTKTNENAATEQKAGTQLGIEASSLPTLGVSAFSAVVFPCAAVLSRRKNASAVTGCAL